MILFDIQFTCNILNLVAGSKQGCAPLNAENSFSVFLCFIVAYAVEKMNILVSVLNLIVFLFYDINLNAYDFVYLEFVTYKLGLWRSMQVLAKRNEYISTKQFLCIHECPNCLPVSKLYFLIQSNLNSSKIFGIMDLFFPGKGNSNHWGFIIAPSEEVNGDNLGMSCRSCKIMVYWMLIKIASLRWFYWVYITYIIMIK